MQISENCALTSLLLFQLEIIKNIDEETFIMTQHYCQQLYYTNFSINFVLYCISGQNFRKALRSLHCPRRRLRRNETAALTGIKFFTATILYPLFCCCNQFYREPNSVQCVFGRFSQT